MSVRDLRREGLLGEALYIIGCDEHVGLMPESDYPNNNSLIGMDVEIWHRKKIDQLGQYGTRV
jgi:hypothetical protein